MEWDVAPAAEIRHFTGHTDRVTGVALSTDGTFAVSAGNDGALIVWDAATGAELRRITSDQGGFSKVVLSPDNHLALTRVATQNNLLLWNITTGELQQNSHWAHRQRHQRRVQPRQADCVVWLVGSISHSVGRRHRTDHSPHGRS